MGKLDCEKTLPPPPPEPPLPGTRLRNACKKLQVRQLTSVLQLLGVCRSCTENDLTEIPPAVATLVLRHIMWDLRQQ